MIGLKKALYFGDDESIVSASEFALSNLIPWYAERLKKKKINEQRRMQVEINAIDQFEEKMKELGY